MSITVTLHVYSGRPNPRWTLSAEQARSLSATLALSGSTKIAEPTQPSSILGYQGFTLETSRKGHPPSKSSIYNRQMIRDVGDALQLPDHAAERLLLDSAGPAVSRGARAEVLDALERQKNASPTARNGLGAPPYAPGVWNDDPHVMANNNCYNYANDIITNSFAQPGRGSGQIFVTFDCVDVGGASIRDGQIPDMAPDQNVDDGQIICLVIWPNEDFHWYRKDSDDYWSHKPGSTPATNLDSHGHVIVDPDTCHRGPYTLVCGYFLCDPEAVTID